MMVKDKKIKEECGVFGIYSDKVISPAVAAYYGLFALQHRGQESGGIAVSDMGVINCHSGMGLVGDIFDDSVLSSLNGQIAIGHVRYSTVGTGAPENTLPLVIRYSKGRLALSLNGCLLNGGELKNELSRSGALFRSDSDAEIMLQIVAKERLNASCIEKAVESSMKRFVGAYSGVLLSPRKLIAFRDPRGFRPLVMGALENSDGDKSYVFASETCALDTIGAKFIRDVEPGEIVVADADGIHSIMTQQHEKKLCVFEYIYFARPDSVIDGVEVHFSRVKAGMILARKDDTQADMVIGVPDSGLDAAIGYARGSGIPYGVGFVRNNYVGRTFIKPRQSMRRASVDIKLNVISEAIAGKRIIMVDDSIVRGSTTVNIIKMLKNAGAKEVHVRIASPTIHYPCKYGTDIPTREELIANRLSIDKICAQIGADSLAFLDNGDLTELAGGGRCFCDACFTGEYAIG